MAKTIRKIEKQAAPAIAPRRVAAYARVFVPTERLLHSLDEQISYYSALIQNTPGWSTQGCSRTGASAAHSPPPAISFRKCWPNARQETSTSS